MYTRGPADACQGKRSRAACVLRRGADAGGQPVDRASGPCNCSVAACHTVSHLGHRDDGDLVPVDELPDERLNHLGVVGFHEDVAAGGQVRQERMDRQPVLGRPLAERLDQRLLVRKVLLVAQTSSADLVLDHVLHGSPQASSTRQLRTVSDLNRLHARHTRRQQQCHGHRAAAGRIRQLRARALAREDAATEASKPSRPPRVPPTIAAFSSSGTPTNCRAMSSRLPERAFGVRVVVAPDDARHAGDVAARDRDRIVLERHVELALHVLARRQRVGPLVVQAEELRDVGLVGGRAGVVPDARPPVGVLADAGDPALVHRAHQRRQPVRVELDQREVEVGVALGDTAADQLADQLRRHDRAVHRLRDHPLRRRLLGHRLVDLLRLLHHDPQRRGRGVVDLHATGLRVEERLHAVCLGRRPHRVELARVVRLGGVAGSRIGAEPGGGDPLDLGDRVVDLGDRNGGGGRDAIEVRREPLDDVVVVDTSVRHRELVVVGVEPEQRQVRVHDRDVDAVEAHVLEGDPGRMLEDMDLDGIDVQLMHPNLSLFGLYSDDHELPIAHARVYNDYVIERYTPYFYRLAPTAPVPLTDIDDAVAEIERVAAAGFRAILLPAVPPTPYYSPDLDPVWAAAQRTASTCSSTPRPVA